MDTPVDCLAIWHCKTHMSADLFSPNCSVVTFSAAVYSTPMSSRCQVDVRISRSPQGVADDNFNTTAKLGSSYVNW